MAETNQEIGETLPSVETDAAPSSAYLDLASLDIGSECTVETATKVETSVPTDTGVIKGEEADQNEQETTKRLARGLWSLNLEGGLGQEVVVKDDDEVVEALVNQDADGDTCLHVEIILQHLEYAIMLITKMQELGVSLDIPNRLQQTALHLAVLTGEISIVKALRCGGASTFARDSMLRTPMFIACEKNNMQLLKEIIQNTVLDNRYSEFTSKLLNPDINPLDLPNVDGERCLHLAARHNNVEMARILVENGADVNLPDRRSGRSALHVAADFGHIEMAQFLISVGNIDINLSTYNGETALEISHLRKRPEVVALLKPLSFPVMKRVSKSE